VSAGALGAPAAERSTGSSPRPAPLIARGPAIWALGAALLATFPASIALLFQWLLWERVGPPFVAPTSSEGLEAARRAAGDPLAAALIDLALLIGFAVPHSWFLRGSGQRLLCRLFPRPLFYTAYGLISAVTLIAATLLWRPIPGVVYSSSGPLEAGLLLGYGLSWAGMGWSLLHYGPLKQPGIAQWLAFVRGAPAPAAGLPKTGPYRFTRHPIYLSMLGMIWGTPWMTPSRLLVATVWTGYLVIGTVLKEARLRRTMRDAWTAYAATVPPFPGLSLLRRRARPTPTLAR
jgi:hypothetical protein